MRGRLTSCRRRWRPGRRARPTPPCPTPLRRRDRKARGGGSVGHSSARSAQPVVNPALPRVPLWPWEQESDSVPFPFSRLTREHHHGAGGPAAPRAAEALREVVGLPRATGVGGVGWCQAEGFRGVRLVPFQRAGCRVSVQAARACAPCTAPPPKCPKHSPATSGGRASGRRWQAPSSSRTRPGAGASRPGPACTCGWGSRRTGTQRPGGEAGGPAGVGYVRVSSVWVGGWVVGQGLLGQRRGKEARQSVAWSRAVECHACGPALKDSTATRGHVPPARPRHPRPPPCPP